MLAPPWFELPPEGYGGIEVVVAALTDQLVQRGHDVVVVSAGRHRTKAQHFERIYEVPPSELLGTPLPEVLQAALAGRVFGNGSTLDVDIVHDHTLAGPLLARGRAIPTLVTMHGPVDGPLGTYFEQLGETINVVAISDAQRRINPRLNWVDTVHNAIDVDDFPFRDRKDGYLLFLGRFCADKGPDLAIDAAQAVGMPIVLAGKCSEPAEREYFARHIEPRLGPGVTYVGMATDTKKDLFAGANALLFPIQWEEPFGMVMIEAMASGTPVVAMRRGSVPEVIDHGRTGFIVETMDDFITAAGRVSDINPANARAHVRANFDLPVMAAKYESIYRRLCHLDPPGAPDGDAAQQAA